MRLGVIGGGIVGHATARAFIEHAEIRVYDVVPEKRTHSLPDTLDSDLIFVSLPTPQRQNAHGCDTSFVDKFFKEHAGYNLNFVLRSTVPVGTTQRLRDEYGLMNLVHSPEFLTARCAVTDAHIPARNIVGGPPCLCRDKLENLYRMRFPGVPVLVMQSGESECVKLALNSHFAQKVAFFNNVKQLADAKCLNWDNILAGMLSDGRIAHAHTKVPGGDSRPGFGGACLRKDLANFISCLEGAGLPSDMLLATKEYNDRLRGEE